MSVYAFAMLTVTDKEALDAYRAVAGDALAKHGGKVVKAGPATDLLDGQGILPHALALLEFPNGDAARAWRDDPELVDVHAMRRSAGGSEIILQGE